MLLVTLFGVAAPYCIGGMVYNKYRHGTDGVEMIPHREFWKAMPGLAKDGILFTKGKLMVIYARCRGESYQSL